MTAERFTPAAIQAERDLLDGDDRRVLGEVVVSIGFTNATVKTLSPREMEEVAAYLIAMITRAPLSTAQAYTAHRVVLGALASELRGFAAAAGEPVGLQADLRAAASQAEERRIRARLADQAAAFDRHIDEVLVAQAFAHRDGPADDMEAAPGEPSASPAPTEPADAPAYVL